MVFRALCEVTRQARASIVESFQRHHHQQQQSLEQQRLQRQSMNNYVPSLSPAQRPLLILPNKTPSPFFTALLDAIFTLALPVDNSTTADLLTPTHLAAVYDELGYQQSDNLPYLLHCHAQRCCDADPRSRVNEGMQMAWRIFELEYGMGTTTAGVAVPGLTRRGFRDMMVRDGLIYPLGQAKAWFGMIEKHRGRLVSMGLTIPVGVIGPEAFMQGGIGVSGDGETKREYRERQQRWVEEYNQRFYGERIAGGVGGGMVGQGQGIGPGMGTDWRMAMQMQQWKHNMTMDAMTPGYRVENGYGGYSYVYTGGFNW